MFEWLLAVNTTSIVKQSQTYKSVCSEYELLPSHLSLFVSKEKHYIFVFSAPSSHSPNNGSNVIWNTTTILELPILLLKCRWIYLVVVYFKSVWLRAGLPGDRDSFPDRGERIFPLASVSRPALGPTQPPV
jgi:hypothetical protein